MRGQERGSGGTGAGGRWLARLAQRPKPRRACSRWAACSIGRTGEWILRWIPRWIACGLRVDSAGQQEATRKPARAFGYPTEITRFSCVIRQAVASVWQGWLPKKSACAKRYAAPRPPASEDAREGTTKAKAQAIQARPRSPVTKGSARILHLDRFQRKDPWYSW